VGQRFIDESTGEWVDVEEIVKASIWTKVSCPEPAVQGKMDARHELTPEERLKGARNGASLGGHARKLALSPERRREIALKAVAAREKRRKL
jgi:hypothetical protein